MVYRKNCSSKNYGKKLTVSRKLAKILSVSRKDIIRTPWRSS